MPNPDVQSRETPSLTPARREALKKAAQEHGYEPVGASQHRMARTLRAQGLLIGGYIRREWRITDRGRNALEASDA